MLLDQFNNYSLSNTYHDNILVELQTVETVFTVLEFHCLLLGYQVFPSFKT